MRTGSTRSAAVLARHENRPGESRQATHHRPAFDIGLGDECNGLHGIDDEDVQPRYVVRHAQGCASRTTSDVQLHAEHREELTRPPSLQAQPQTLRQHGIDQARHAKAAGEVQRDAREPECGDEMAGHEAMVLDPRYRQMTPPLSSW